MDFILRFIVDFSGKFEIHGFSRKSPLAWTKKPMQNRSNNNSLVLCMGLRTGISHILQKKNKHISWRRRSCYNHMLPFWNLLLILAGISKFMDFSERVHLHEQKSRCKIGLIIIVWYYAWGWEQVSHISYKRRTSTFYEGSAHVIITCCHFGIYCWF